MSLDLSVHTRSARKGSSRCKQGAARGVWHIDGRALKILDTLHSC